MAKRKRESTTDKKIKNGYGQGFGVTLKRGGSSAFFIQLTHAINAIMSN